MRLLFRAATPFLVILCVLACCETDPVMYIDTAPIPVIYGIFDSKDTVHYLKVGRIFGAGGDPAKSASIYDSIYFDNQEVSVRITKWWDTVSINLDVERVDDIPKDDGIFSSPAQALYRFNYDFQYPHRFFGKVWVEVNVPDLKPARADIAMVWINRDSFSTPKFAQQYVYLNETSPLRVHWFGNSWNEVDVKFEFVEDLGQYGTRVKAVKIQNTNSFISPHKKYREMKITYDEFIREVLQQIPKNDSVNKTHLSYISVAINGGDYHMAQYQRYYDGFNDYDFHGYTNIENGLGIVASRTSILIDSMQFDRDTRRLLLNENRLKVLKLTEK